MVFMRSSDGVQSGNRRSNFFYSFLLLPKVKRRAIITLYDFCRHTDDIVDGQGRLEQKSERLAAWKDEMIRSFRGDTTDSLLTEVSSIASAFGISHDLFLELLSGVQMDLTATRYQTFDELYPYCYKVGSTVGLMSIEIFGYRNPEAKQYAVNLGIALQLTNILRDLRSDLQNDRVYLPQEDLLRFGYKEEELFKRIANDSFHGLIRFECARARDFFQAARRFLKDDDLHSLYPAETMASIYEKLLGRIERNPPELFRREIKVSFSSRVGVALHNWLKHNLQLVDAN
jgi:phytoene synthase